MIHEVTVENAPLSWQLTLAEYELVLPSGGIANLNGFYTVPSFSFSPQALELTFAPTVEEVLRQHRVNVTMMFNGVKGISLELSDLEHADDFAFQEISLRRIGPSELGFLVILDFGELKISCESLRLGFT